VRSLSANTGVVYAMSSDTTPYVESWLTGPLSTSFYTRLYNPPSSATLRGAVVFVHGYLEHIGRYTASHAAWAARGFAVFAYDMRGFGRTALDESAKSPGSSYGKTGGMNERMLDVEWAVQHTRELVDASVPLFLMGHSMVSLVVRTAS
jgi:acylglycerol lipase